MANWDKSYGPTRRTQNQIAATRKKEDHMSYAVSPADGSSGPPLVPDSADKFVAKDMNNPPTKAVMNSNGAPNFDTVAGTGVIKGFEVANVWDGTYARKLTNNYKGSGQVPTVRDIANQPGTAP